MIEVVGVVHGWRLKLVWAWCQEASRLSHMIWVTGSMSHQLHVKKENGTWCDMELTIFFLTWNWCDRQPITQHRIALKLFCRMKSGWLYFTLLESCQIGVGSGWIQLYLIEVHFYRSSSLFAVAIDDLTVKGCVWREKKSCVWFDKEREEKLCLVW